MAVNAVMHRFVYLVGLTAIVWLRAAPAAACSCMPAPPPQDALRSASAVFEGAVTALTETEGQLQVRFEVTRSWKGVEHEAVDVRTAIHGATCGIGFQVGRSYLVYATANDSGALRTGLCSRTALADEAAADFEALGPGSIPVDLPETVAKQEKTPVQRAGCASCTVGHAASSDGLWAALPFLGLIGWRLTRRGRG